MYQAHFGLTKALFDSGIAQGASVFLGAKEQAMVANAKIALSTRDSVLALTGPAGVGKTTLASAALRESSTRLALGWLGGTPANPSELLELLLVELGVDAPRAGRMERLQMWRQFLNESNATDSRVFVIVERADDLSAPLLRSLESFTAADPNGCAGANVVLLGGDALVEQLKTPALDSLRQRIRLRQKLEPLGVDELRAYLEHHVTLAGGELHKVFAADAVSAIHRYTAGVPRLVNNLCETALTLAAASSQSPVAGELVAKAATGLLGLDDAASSSAAAEGALREVATGAPQSEPPLAPAAPVSAAEPRTSSATALPASAAPTPRAAAATTTTRAAVTTATATRTATPTPSPTRAAASPSAAMPELVTAPAAAAAALPHAGAPLEFRGDETDIVADELLTATLVNETPEVAMAEFPVLTDAVESPEPRRSPAKPAAFHAAAKQSTPPAAANSVRPALTPPQRLAAATPRPRPPGTPPSASEASVGAPRTSQKPRSHADADDHDTKTMRALADAKSIDDISNSMAETLFGGADLDMLSRALAAGDWGDSSEVAETAADKTDAGTDGLDLFDLGPDAPLELIDDSSLPPQVGGRKLVSGR